MDAAFQKIMLAMEQCVGMHLEMAEETNKRLSALLAARCPKAVLLAGQPNSLASTLTPDRRGMLLIAAAACYD